MTADTTALLPIERDEEMNRTYIPLPGGYEIQTKGNGSTFRIAKTDGSDERMPVLESVLHPFLEQMARDIRKAHEAALAENARLRALINTPELDDFAKGVVLEAVHQQERWGAAHDAGKMASDWYWLVGHLAGKAFHHANEYDLLSKLVGAEYGSVAEDRERHRQKMLHHAITAAAALANWHLHLQGIGSMRPGIETPPEVKP